MTFLLYKSINPQALHLAYCYYQLRLSAVDIRDSKLYSKVTKPASIAKAFSTDEQQHITRLLKYTHGVSQGTKEFRDRIDLNLFLKLCAVLGVNPIQVFELPYILIQRDKGKETFKILLSYLLGSYDGKSST